MPARGLVRRRNCLYFQGGEARRVLANCLTPDMNAAQQQPVSPPGDTPGPRTSENPEVATTDADSNRPREIGGRGGLDPTRYGDWERAGRCIDF